MAPARPVGRLVPDVQDDRRSDPTHRVPARVPAQPGPRRGLPGRGADAVGRHLPDRRRAGRAARTASTPATTTGSRSTAPTVEHVFIETTRPELIPACVALVAHPDDERYQALFGTTVRSPLFDVEVPVVAHHLAEPDKGTGIAMVCTFGDLTDVIWWRELQPADPLGRRPGRPAPARHPDVARPRAGRDGVRRARRARRRSRPGHADGGAAARSRRPRRRADARPSASAKFYEKGDKPLEIVTTRQWYIRNGGRDEDLRADVARAWRRARSGCPTYMQQRYENWVERAQRRLADQPAALLRRAVPGLVPARRRRRDRLRPGRCCRPRTSCRSTRRRRHPPATPTTSATSPAASSATRTSWTPGRRRR